MSRVTIFEIARRAGVSTGTVSRALNGRADVSPATRAKVLRLVRDLGYVPDSGARRLARGRLELVGVAPFSENTTRSPYYSILLDAIQEQLFHTGYAARVLDLAGDEAGRCAGVIIPGMHLHDPRLEQLSERGVPYVVVGRAEGVSWVDPDNAGGIAQALHHLIKLGHTQIAHLTGSPIGQTTQARLEAYQEGLRAADLPVLHELIWDGGFTDLGGYRATRKALETGLEFTAVLCASDEMALGAMAALQDAGLQVPLDVSVVGFDDLALAAHTRPTLTTVRQPIRAVGRMAADLLVETLQGAPPRTEILPTELIVRASSGPALGGRRSGAASGVRGQVG